ncbi:MAG: OmpA family protein [Acetobacteraceae bacterium]
MRTLPLLLLLPAAAMAQVTVNPGVLDHLAPSTPKTEHKPAPHRPAHRPPAHHPAHPATRAPEKPAPALAEKPPAPKPPSTAIAPAPPPVAVLPPPVLPPQPAPAPVALAPVVADAVGVASKIPGGLRVTFGAGKADLNPDTSTALHALARVVLADPAATVNVYAYATGSADDPSTPRRLSLSRALAARAVLISEGIASTRVYVRALGATPSDGPPDRVDVTQVGMTAVTPAAASATPPASSPPAPPSKPATP